MKPKRMFFVTLALLLAMTVWMPPVVFAQSGSSALPKHATPQRVYLDFKAAIRRITPSAVYVRKFVFHNEPHPHLDMQGSGSGIIVSPDGYILTNEHVVRGAGQLDVLVERKKYLRARIVGTDREKDLALIKVDAPTEFGKLMPARFTKASTVGEWVMKAGFPGSVDSTDTPTFTLGVISHLRTFDDEDRSTPFGATDTQLGPGDSGGMLFNIGGEVVGVNRAVSGGGITYYVPAEIILRALPRLYRGNIRTGWLGIVPSSCANMRDVHRDPYLLSNLQRFLASQNTILPSVSEGMLVVEIPDRQAGDANLLQVGDVITHVNGKVPRDTHELVQWIAETEPGDTVTFQLIRDGSRALLHLKVGEFRWDGSMPFPQAPSEEGQYPPGTTP